MLLKKFFVWCALCFFNEVIKALRQGLILLYSNSPKSQNKKFPPYQRQGGKNMEKKTKKNLKRIYLEVDFIIHIKIKKSKKIRLEYCTQRTGGKKQSFLFYVLFKLGGKNKTYSNINSTVLPHSSHSCTRCS